ncbi:hypothetical protein [Altererythrobacter fulvus]|uniref:hypothetical protein n=1 Tax=Caenibius fulvus TaxID=2126012 RepID=UPI0030186399
MTVHEVVHLLCTSAIALLALFARDRLRINEPKVRIAFGSAGIFLATFIFFVVNQLFPHPWESGFSSLTDGFTLVASYAIGGLLVLSLIEIAGGILQAVQRRRYNRRKVRFPQPSGH